MIALNVMQEKITALKKEKNAVILSHFYQTIDIQQIADYVGDSFELSKISKTTSENTIVFCGVSFMAESAKLLSPDKKILLPNINAGCPMADMVTPDIIKDLKKQYPNAAVVCYVNSSAESKAECDICCTSSNAVKIVKSLEQKEIIFVPDVNLGTYVSQFVPDKKFIYIDGYCPIHAAITENDVKSKKEEYPDAKFAVHPECDTEVLKLADFIGSTSEILKYCIESDNSEFIIGTEYAIVERLRFYYPNKKYHALTPNFICPNMKKTTLENLYNSLLKEETVIELSPELITKANVPLERMLAAAK